jgi:IS605 OrfB family transposase
VLKANKYRLYPSDKQKELPDKHFGIVRLVFNLALETKTWAYSAHKTSLSGYGLQVELKDLKEDCPWPWEVNSQSLKAAALLNLDMAVRQLFQKILLRRVSRKVTGGSNRKKSVKRLTTLPEKITNQRKDYIHKVTDAIARQYDTVCVEDLAVSNMIKNHNPAQLVSDAGWGMFGIFPKYKADWRGTSILEIGKFEPRTKLPNSCGFIHKNLILTDRQWACPRCGKVVNRDEKCCHKY